jgi:CheY-like chemotaxis protein
MVVHPDVQIQHLMDVEVPELIRQLPYDSWHNSTIRELGGLWIFEIECNSVTRRFFAKAQGKTPAEAFAAGKYILTCQIRDWHKTRFQDDADLAGPVLPASPAPRDPRVLIVDDDVDLALSLQAALAVWGITADVATQHEDLHRRIIAQPVDFILMDWQLNGTVTADQVVERATRLIDTFSDLRERFMSARPRVVTYSVLERDNIALPLSGNKYFMHVDHWQKPMPFHEVVEKASALLGHT